VVGEAQQERLGRADAVAGEREDRVLLRVGGHDVRVVAREVRGGEVAASCDVTFRSSISCLAVSRVTFTTRTSALPYWFGPRTMAGSDMAQLPR
jgi:hypothetical protein